MLAIALIGLMIAAYSIPLHYQSGGAKWCNVNDTLNCDKVNQSPWAEILGIPVAILGTIAFLALFIIVLMRRRIERALSFNRKDLSTYILLFVMIMLGFQLYLTYAEFFLIRAYCIVCLSSQLTVLVLAALAYADYKRAK